jgi:hypothetical protein
VDVVKLDVEGAEPQVLEGATSLLETRSLNRIILEYNTTSWVTKDGLLRALYATCDMYRFIYSPFLLKRIADHTLRTATYPFDVFLTRKASSSERAATRF